MALTKHEFIDEYPYLVYTDEQTTVYSDKADTSIDDILPSGTIEITENGEGIDVAQYAYANVNVSGGSVALGNLAMGLWTTQAVSIGSSASSTTVLEATQVKIGDVTVVDSVGQAIQNVASGADAISLYSSDFQLTFTQAYDVTVDIDTGKYVTVEEIDMDVLSTNVEIEGETLPAWEYTVPSIAEGHFYVLKFTSE